MVSIRNSVLRWVAMGLLAVSAPLMSGCTTTSILLSAAGVATDNSVTLEIVKHLHDKMTEGDSVPCYQLNSVQRALNARCGPFVPGSLQVADIRNSQLQSCPLAVAVRDPQFWPVVPELLDKGALPESCARSPMVELAQLQACPDFAAASPEIRASLRWMAEADARAIHHDVVRMLSCPTARVAGLDSVLTNWMAQGEFDMGRPSFGPLGALHPDYLNSPFARALEAQGHTALEGLGGYDGVQPRGFEVALRTSNFAALDWWLNRVPQLANRVPPMRSNQLPWVPLAKVVTPNFVAVPGTQTEMVEYLMARGANPWQKLPFDSGTSVVQYARSLKSPMVALLDPPPAGATVVAVGVVAAQGSEGQ
jgi:hypothetical protein